MVIRNKEERTDSIWRFIGVAIVPLLFLFLAGFSLGNTSGKEKQDFKKKYETASAKADSFENKVSLYNAFSKRADILLKIIDQKTDELDKKISTAASASDKEMMVLLSREESDLFRDIGDSMHLVGRDFRQVASDAPITSGLSLLSAYIGFKKIRQMKYREDLMNKINEGDQTNLQAELDKIKAEKEEIKSLVEGQKVGTEMSDLKAQLRDCQGKLAAVQQSASGGSNKNKEAVANIKATLNEIQKSMLPKISDTKFKNDSKKLNELRTQIGNSLTIATTELNTIQ